MAIPIRWKRRLKLLVGGLLLAAAIWLLSEALKAGG